MTVLIAALMGVAGVLVGGVLNVLADDLPARRAPRCPRYPDGTLRPRSAWLGLSAFLSGQRAAILRATSPASGEATSPARLSWRHPILELACAALFVLLATGYADEPTVWAWFVYGAILLLVTVIDIEHRLILRVVVLPAAAFALFAAVVSPMDKLELRDYLLGGLLGFGLFYLLYLGGAVYVALRGLNVVAFGFGDVMLAGLSGLMLGWQAFIFAAVLTILAGAAGSLVYMLGSLLINRRMHRFKPLPYGPYIVFGTLMMLLARDEVRELLWRGYG